MVILVIFFLSPEISAQFYTVTRTQKKVETKETFTPHNIDTLIIRDTVFIRDTIHYSSNREEFRKIRMRYKNGNEHNSTSSKKSQNECDSDSENHHLPRLTLLNLYDEIVRNGIRHPKIVLAQAILETGWFQSQVCRTKNNLFGLTNPKTSQYYEFSHWTESVRAYYTKVQYRYKGGNYLRWLDEIGYAEDPHYINSLKKILATHLDI